MATFVKGSTQDVSAEEALVFWYKECGIADVAKAGGKNASLGEMIQHPEREGIRIPNGFATAAYAYQHFLKRKELDGALRKLFADLSVEDLDEVREVGRKARSLIIETHFPRAPEAGNLRWDGICGQAPGDYPEFARFLVEQGIDSISLNPDSVLKTMKTAQKLKIAAS